MKKMKKPAKKPKQISKSMSFSEILEKNPELAKTLLDRGMHCAGCPMAMSETLEEGALAHGYDPDEIEKDINKKLNKTKKKK
jgi:hybrid cluster-associated redox disulfide protein